MVRKPNRARPTPDTALLLSWGIGLLVCHERDHAAGATAAIALTLMVGRGAPWQRRGGSATGLTLRWSSIDRAPLLLATLVARLRLVRRPR